MPLVRRAAELGRSPWVFDRDPAAPAREHAARFDAVSAHDPEAILVRVRERAGEGRPAGVISGSNAPDALFAAAVVARALRLPGPDPDAVNRVLDKGSQTSVLVTSRFPHPKTVVAFGADEAVAAAKRARRAVLKPAARTSGSAGVSVADASGADLERRAVRAEQAGDGRVLVQEFVEGDLYSLSALAGASGVRVLAFARKELEVDPPLPRGFSVEPPRTASAEDRRRRSLGCELCGSLAQAFGLAHTAFNVELVWTQAGPVVLELGLGLDAKVDRLLERAGADPYAELCALAQGEERPAPELARAAATRFLYARTLLRLAPAAWSAAEAAAAEEDAALERQAPLDVRLDAPARSLADTLGWIVAHGADAAEARARAERVERAVLAALQA